MVVQGDDFIDAFAEALKREYRKNHSEKGDSFLGMRKGLLYDKLDEEYTEVFQTTPDATQELMGELVDLGLVSAMCWWRENGQTTPYVQPPR